MKPPWMKDLDFQCLCRHDFEERGVSWGLFLPPHLVSEAVRRLDQKEYFLEDISCVDTVEGFVVIYHFSSWAGPDRVVLYAILNHHGPQIPTISDRYGGALWHERETRDFFGIHFSGHPDLTPLLLPEDMTEHPLQKGEKDRVPLRELIRPGEIVERKPDFRVFEEMDGVSHES